MVVSATALTGGSLGGTLSGLALAMIITEFKDFVAPLLTTIEKEKENNEYIENINREID